MIQQQHHIDNNNEIQTTNTGNDINNNNTAIEISNNNEINNSNENDNKYIFAIKFNYPDCCNNIVILKKERENRFIWTWSNCYPMELRDFISKEDFEKDIKLINGLKSYYSFVIGLFSFWVLFFIIVLVFVGLIPKFSPIILGLFAPFLFFSVLNLVWQCKKREAVYINYIENKLLSVNAKYRDVNITWKLCKQRWINFYRIKKLKSWIEITLPNTPMELTQSYPPFSNIELSMNKIDNLDY